MIVYYDDACEICYRFVKKTRARCKGVVFKGRRMYKSELYEKYKFEQSVRSMLVFSHNHWYAKGAAVEKLAAKMKRKSILLCIYQFLPRFMQNTMYDVFAKSRGLLPLCVVDLLVWP